MEMAGLSKTAFCESCDAAAADAIALLPHEYQVAIRETVRRLTLTYAAMAGVTLPQRPLPPNVVRLRQPQKTS